MKYGLLGRHLSHTYSPIIHGLLGNKNYTVFEKEPEELEQFLRSNEFAGINVTIPYKTDVLPYCMELSPQAQKVGAVNTIIRREDGTLFGHNSDYFGFYATLQKSGLSVKNKKVLVLGSGGASKAVCAVLGDMQANTVIISRSGENNYENLHLHRDAAVIVNTTPLGMYPKTGVSALSLKGFPALEGVIDVIYNPGRTQLLLDAEHMGLVTENGLYMVVAQAVECAKMFMNKEIPISEIDRIYLHLRSQRENIVLVGMPGCGKTTVGKLLAEALGKTFVDCDETIEREANMPIPQIFAEGGEERFRKLETQALSLLGKQSGQVIATGGGCVTRPENYDLLHQNARIVWLKRDIEDLPTDGRPLSLSGNLAEMYALRKPLYERFADFSIQNCRTPNETVNTILSYLQKEDAQ